MGLKDWLTPVALQKKSSVVANAVIKMMNGQPVWTPKNYAALSKEGFEKNVWVFRCVMAIAQSAAGVDWVLYQRKGRKLVEIEDHPLLNLLYKPNEVQSKQEFFESLVAYALLSGNSYIEMNGPKNGPPMELWTLRPDRMTIKPGAAYNIVGGYTYTAGSTKVDLAANQVMHLKTFHALNDYYGFSPLEAAARGIDTDNAANSWNNGLLNNGARLSGAMVTPNQLNEPQYDRLKGELNRAYKGAANAGKFMLLEGGLDWKEMGLSPKDMDFIHSKKMSRVEICGAFGVPPEIVGDKEHATYSNYQEARQSFYQETVLPWLDRIRDKMNNDLVRQFGDNLYLDYDKDTIEALQENTNEKAKRIREDVTAGIITRAEGRAALGYDYNELDEVFYIPSNNFLVDKAGKIIIQPARMTQPQAAADDGEGGDATGNTKAAGNDEDPYTALEGLLKKAFDLEGEEQKANYWESVEKRREQFYEAAIQQAEKRMDTERKAVVKAFESGGLDALENEMKLQQKELAKMITAIDQLVISEFGQSVMNELKADTTEMEQKAFGWVFDAFTKSVTSWIKNNVGQKVKQINETTMNAIKDLVEIGQKEGESIPEIAKRLDSLYLDEIIPNRSTVIARTEVISSSNAGSRFGAKQTGLELTKEWLATRDERTRDTHKDMDGVTAAMDEPYNVPHPKNEGETEPLMFPGDPKGSAGNVIQCRCTEIYKRVKK